MRSRPPSTADPSPTPGRGDPEAETLGIGVSRRAVVRGTSMEPAISSGDVLTVEAQGAESPTAGEVVSFRDDFGNVLTHRLIGREGVSGRQLMVTQGDGRTEPDPPWVEDRLLGTVTSAEHPPARLLRRLISFERLAWWELGEMVATRLRAARALRQVQRRFFGETMTVREERRAPPSREWLAVTCTATDSRGNIVGWQTVVRQSRLGDAVRPLWLLFGLQVRLRYRGAGIGRRLVAAGERAVAREGGGRLYAFVRPENRPSIGVFEASGWHVDAPPMGTVRVPELAACLCFIKDV